MAICYQAGIPKQVVLYFQKISRNWPGEESIDHLPVWLHFPPKKRVWKLLFCSSSEGKTWYFWLRPGLKEKAGTAEGSRGNFSVSWRQLLQGVGTDLYTWAGLLISVRAILILTANCRKFSEGSQWAPLRSLCCHLQVLSTYQNPPCFGYVLGIMEKFKPPKWRLREIILTSYPTKEEAQHWPSDSL